MKSIWIGLFDGYDNELLEKSYNRVEVKLEDFSITTEGKQKTVKNKNKINLGSSINPWGVIHKVMLFENEHTNTPFVETPLNNPCRISSDTTVSIEAGKLVIKTDKDIFS